MRGVKKNMLTEKTNLDYKKYCISFFYILFFINNFNALLQIFVPRMIYTCVYVLFLVLSVFVYLKHINWCINRNDLQSNQLVCGFIIICIFRYIVQVVVGDYTALSLNRFLQTVVPVLVYFPTILLNADEREKIEVFYVKCSLVSVLCGLINQVTGILPARYFANEMVRVGSGVTSRSYSMAGFSLGTGTICGIAIALLLKNSKKFGSFFRAFSFAVFIYGLLKTYSRGGVFFVIIIVIIYAWLNLIWSGNSMSKNVIAAALIGMVVLVSLIVLYGDRILQSSFWTRYVLNVFDGSTSLRREFQRRALQLIKKYPLFGRGFGFVGSNAYSQFIGEGFPPENNYLQMAIDCGIFAAGAYILFAFKSVFTGLRKRNESKRAYIGIVVGFLMWSLMSTPLEGDLNAALFWYCIGSIIAYCPTENQKTLE